MPPWAATVWLRVGKSLEMHAVLNPASARPNAARSPEPPAPTTTASYSWSYMLVNWWSLGRSQSGGGERTMTGYLLLTKGDASFARRGWFAMTLAVRSFISAVLTWLNVSKDLPAGLVTENALV